MKINLGNLELAALQIAESKFDSEGWAHESTEFDDVIYVRFQMYVGCGEYEYETIVVTEDEINELSSIFLEEK